MRTKSVSPITVMIDYQTYQEIMYFLYIFELVFHGDWDHTKMCLKDAYFIHPDSGTFLEPKVEDEDHDWANRGSILYAYRVLREKFSTNDDHLPPLLF